MVVPPTDTQTFEDQDGDPSRVGAAQHPLFGTQQLETTISARDGRTGMSKDLQRAQVKTTGPPALARVAFTRIAEVCQAMQLDSRAIIQAAQHAYLVAEGAGLAKPTRGKQEAVIGACIIFATRGIPGGERTFKDVERFMASDAKVTRKEMGKASRLLKTAIDAKDAAAKEADGILSSAPSAISSPSAAPRQTLDGQITRFSSYLGLDMRVQAIAAQVASNAMHSAGVESRSPLSVAAAALYFAVILLGREKKVQSKDIAGVAGVADVTVSLVCRKICESIDKVANHEWVSTWCYLLVLVWNHS